MASGSKQTGGNLTNEENRKLALLKLQVQTFYQVNQFVGSIYNREQLLDLNMREAEAAVPKEAKSSSKAGWPGKCQAKNRVRDL